MDFGKRVGCDAGHANHLWLLQPRMYAIYENTACCSVLVVHLSKACLWYFCIYVCGRY